MCKCQKLWTTTWVYWIRLELKNRARGLNSLSSLSSVQNNNACNDCLLNFHEDVHYYCCCGFWSEGWQSIEYQEECNWICNAHLSCQCPALISPHLVTSFPFPTEAAAKRRWIRGRKRKGVRQGGGHNYNAPFPSCCLWSKRRGLFSYIARSKQRNAVRQKCLR